MAGPVLHVGAQTICPHGGQATFSSGAPRVLVSNQPIATAMSDAIAGCAFTVPPAKPQPCVLAQWATPATKVLAQGQPVITRASLGLCQSAEQIPGGPAIVTNCQPKVFAL
jgi:hypothetical protein